jgi:hypothetical protein
MSIGSRSHLKNDESIAAGESIVDCPSMVGKRERESAGVYDRGSKQVPEVTIEEEEPPIDMTKKKPKTQATTDQKNSSPAALKRKE